MTSSSQLAGKRSSISRASRVLYSRFVKLGASDGCTELACSKSKMYVSMSVIRCNPEFKMEEKIPQSLCLWGNKKLEPQNKDDKVGNILEQNNLNRLQMVQFECPWIINPSSCSFGRFALRANARNAVQCLLPDVPSSPPLCSNKKWFIMGSHMGKVGNFLEQIQLSRLQMIQFE